ncbi:MAG: hypothetical protein JRH18_12035 [Deltaproteobacteria bacterium]|nr:hypothetical protein [Deltaproteobacteria bacterium]MBW1960957.1 hypothetical protein [Deltaproteobacteria bacterium]MBW2152388.1 hypothetical protein [Deltaproteobacteria bacterium]
MPKDRSKCPFGLLTHHSYDGIGIGASLFLDNIRCLFYRRAAEIAEKDFFFSADEIRWRKAETF